MNEDMSEYLGVFLDEANEQMELLEQDILRLEQESSPELLNEIFRAAHTLKGSSRAMGFTPMGELTHAMEDIFDFLRQDKLSVSGELVDALFAGLDALKEMKEQIASSGTTTCDTTVQTARLRKVLAGQGDATSAPQPVPAPSASPVASVAEVAPVVEVAKPSAPSVSSTCLTVTTQEEWETELNSEQFGAMLDALMSGYSIYGMRVQISSDCIMKSVRALMLLQTIEQVGSLLAITPDEDKLDNEEFEDTFEIVVATENSVETLFQVAGSVNEVRVITLSYWPAAQQDIGMGSEGSDTEAPLLLTPTQQMAVQDALASGCNLLNVRITIAADCLMKSVRALMAMQAMEQIGSLIAVSPGEEALENEQFDNSFELLLATEQNEEAIQAVVGRVTEVIGVLVRPWNETREANVTSTPVEMSVPETSASAPTSTPVVEAVVTRSEPQAASAPSPSAPAKSAEEAPKGAGDKKPAAPVPQAQTVRVDVSRLDKLLNLVGELVIDRTRIAQLGVRFEQEYGFDDLIEGLNETAAHVGRITDELQEEIMKARMLPVDNVFNRFPRMIRDLAQKLEKEVAFEVMGKETELDRSVIEVIGDPLIHMLRNSVDHGIELPDEREQKGKPRTGTVWLRARHQENHIVIEIEDDGRGMDAEKLKASAVSKGVLTQEAASRMTEKEAINLIFAPGFSTAKEISDVSGRGVGMDIVKSNLQKLGAIVDIESKIGIGSRFTVKLPLTLAIIRGLLINVRDCVYALPLTSVIETLKVDEESIHAINHREVFVQRGRTLPIVRLRNVFTMEAASTPAERMLSQRENVERLLLGITPEIQLEDTITESEPQERPRRNRNRKQALYMVVVGMAEQQIGLVVDSLIGEQEIVIKTLGKFIGDIRGISGGTILGDGRVALIVDINGLIHIALDEKGKAYAA